MVRIKFSKIIFASKLFRKEKLCNVSNAIMYFLKISKEAFIKITFIAWNQQNPKYGCISNFLSLNIYLKHCVP